MVGIGRVTRLRFGKHQPFPTHDHEETVTSGNIITSEHADQHQPQFVTAYTRILRPDFSNEIENLALMFNLFLDVCLRLVEEMCLPISVQDNPTVEYQKTCKKQLSYKIIL